MKDYCYHVAFQYSDRRGTGFGHVQIWVSTEIKSWKDVNAMKVILRESLIREDNLADPTVVIIHWTRLPGDDK